MKSQKGSILSFLGEIFEKSIGTKSIIAALVKLIYKSVESRVWAAPFINAAINLGVADGDFSKLTTTQLILIAAVFVISIIIEGTRDVAKLKK